MLFTCAIVCALTAATAPRENDGLGIWVWDSWPIYNGSNVDCSHWDWPLLSYQFLVTPYLPTNTRAEPELFKYADKHGVNLIHTPSGAATDDLRANLADPRARAPFVAKEVAVLNESGRFVGTNLDFEGIRDHCPNQTKLNNPCVVGFTALVAELREQLPSRSPGTVAGVSSDFG